MSTPSESKKKSQLSKNQLKRLKKKNKPVEKKSISPPPLPHDAQNDERDLATEVDHKEEEINVEELPEEFKKIFEKFQPVEEEKTVSQYALYISLLTDSRKML